MTSLLHPRLYQMLGKQFDAVCTIQEAAEAQDGAGQPIQTWADVPALTAIAARVSPSGGTEHKTPNAVWTLSTHVISLAGYYPAITTKMRAVVSGQAYDILLPEHGGGFGDENPLHTRLVCQVVR